MAWLVLALLFGGALLGAYYAIKADSAINRRDFSTALLCIFGVMIGIAAMAIGFTFGYNA